LFGGGQLLGQIIRRLAHEFSSIAAFGFVLFRPFRRHLDTAQTALVTGTARAGLLGLNGPEKYQAKNHQ
jgi:hypothetical protein